MDTNRLKKFAQKARILLMEGVRQRFLYWGFDKDGNVLEPVEKTSGGYMFRGQVYNDETVYLKWQNLVTAIQRHSVEDIIEEAAYTWFNRLIATRILEKNGYTQPILEYVSRDLQEPVLLRNAKKGILPTSDPDEISELKRIVTSTGENETFASLLVYHCRNHHLLKRVFGKIDDYTELLIPNTLINDDNILTMLNSSTHISDEEYSSVELIGWLYQFYISERKDEVFAGFKKKKKARPEDIPAATQIFTPKWIVKYLVENTLGKLWLDLHPDSRLREKMEYLVETQNPTPAHAPISDISELKILDPAVGSGHFLVVAFDLLIDMYIEEGYSKRKAVQSIIRNNIFGLDVCERAASLARFSVLLKAGMHSAEIVREAPLPNIFSMPESYRFTKTCYSDIISSEFSDCIDEISTTFDNLTSGKNLGSVISLNVSTKACNALVNALNSFQEKDDYTTDTNTTRFLEYANVTIILAEKFHVMVTNPPYMGSRNMNSELSSYLKVNYPASKSDLFSVFIDMMRNRTIVGGSIGMITMESWMFLGTHEALRKKILDEQLLLSILHLGWNVIGIAFGTVAFIAQITKPQKDHQIYFYTISMDDIDKRTMKPKVNPFKHGSGENVRYQDAFSAIPGAPVAYWAADQEINAWVNKTKIESLTISDGQNKTGNNDKYLRYFWELSEADLKSTKWIPYAKGGAWRKWYGNLEYFIDWSEDARAHYRRDKIARLIPEYLWYKEGVTWSFVTTKNIGFRYLEPGGTFDVQGSSLFFDNEELVAPVLGLMNTKPIRALLKMMNPTISLQVKDVRNIPIPKEVSWDELGERSRELIHHSKNDWDAFECSLGFQGNPLFSVTPIPESIEESWKQYVDDSTRRTNQVLTLEKQLNEAIIDAYNLQESYTSDLQLNEVTLKTNPWHRYSELQDSSIIHKEFLRDTVKELISYIVGCIMGRFRLDTTGFNITGPVNESEELLTYIYNGIQIDIDNDAILPVMGTGGSFSDDILQRIPRFIFLIWGEYSYTENLNFIHAALGEDLEKYLTKSFWNDHKKLYKKKPIYWQFASKKGAFKVLTYMHRMNRFTVQKIRQNYLFKHISYLEGEIASLSQNESALIAKETKKLDKMRSDLIECREYDILLKDVADRQIEFDLNDGVTANYKLFEGAVTPI